MESGVARSRKGYRRAGIESDGREFEGVVEPRRWRSVREGSGGMLSVSNIAWREGGRRGVVQ